MNRLPIILLSLLAIATSILLFPLGAPAVFIGGIAATIVVIFISKQEEDKSFLLYVFFIGLLLRCLCALLIYSLDLQVFFGPDGLTYEDWGFELYNYLIGNIGGNYDPAQAFTKQGWSVVYLIGGIYYIVGKNPLAVQFFCCVVGAATAPVSYNVSKTIFANNRVAKISAIIIAVFPSLCIWSSQILKDGFVVFLLMTSILAVINLEKKYSIQYIIVLMLSLIGILTLRFYIFYMLVVATVGCFAVGRPLNPMTIFKRSVVLLFIGVALTALGGGTGRFSSDLDNFNLTKVQQTREDLARGNAGYAKDTDVTTTGGAISALPTGITYLMLAPFPWQMGNLRQAITLPEMILWWGSMPFMVMGLMWSIRNRLRASVSVLLFTLMLTVAYSLYQGNVGSAYRQRAQIQVFYFMFISVGYTLWREKQENRAILKKLKRQSNINKVKNRHSGELYAENIISRIKHPS